MLAMWRAVLYRQTYLSSSFLSSATFSRGYKKDTEFFNRTYEVETIREILHSQPQFSLITGLVHSGKSTLMTEVLQTLRTERPSPSILSIDMRNQTFRDVESFCSSMISSLQSWFSTYLHEIYGDLKIMDFTEISISVRTKGPEASLKIMYQKLSNALPTWSMLRGHNIPPPILFLDEANRLSFLSQDDDGGRVLNDFFAWIVENSKQANRFHVVMASSDSFFLKWINQFVDSAAYGNFFLGHLSQNDAKKFWEKLEKEQKNTKGILPLEFIEANKVCGGSIHLLKGVHRLYYASKGIIHPNKMGYIDKRRFAFIKALRSQAIWQPSNLLYVMEAIVTSEHNCVDYDVICNKIGTTAIDAMIENNLFHLRPCSIFDTDIDNGQNFDAKFPVIMPHLPFDVIVMEDILAS